MAEPTPRLRNLVAAEVPCCTDADVTERLEALESMAEAGDQLTGEMSVLEAMADETRLRILRLAAAADRPLCVCEFDAVLPVSESAVSHALSRLRTAGLVERETDGRWHFYAPTPRAQRLLEAVRAS